MEDLHIEEGKQTPKIVFQSGSLLIEGKSYPENSFEFYEPIIEWLDNYFSGDIPDTVIDFKMKYFNSATKQTIFDMFDIVADNSDSEERVTINWYYDKSSDGGYEDYVDYSEEFEDLNIKAVAY
jgi:hypothetical protein